jgi:fatty acid/phospholipid biosynthesis enzyme
LKAFSDLEIVFVGAEETLTKALLKSGIPSTRYSVVNAPKVIGLNEAPTLAVFHQKDSSLVRSLDLSKKTRRFKVSSRLVRAALY